MAGAGRRAETRVLVTIDEEGYVQVYGEKHVKARIVRVPAAKTPTGQRTAEEIVYAQLPYPYKDLYLPGKVRAAGISSPLDPRAALDSLRTKRSIKELNRCLAQPKQDTSKRSES